MASCHLIQYRSGIVVMTLISVILMSILIPSAIYLCREGERYSNQMCQIKDCTTITEVCYHETCDYDGCENEPSLCYTAYFTLTLNEKEKRSTSRSTARSTFYTGVANSFERKYTSLPTMCAFNETLCYYDSGDQRLVLVKPDHRLVYMAVTLLGSVLIILIPMLLITIFSSITCVSNDEEVDEEADQTSRLTGDLSL